MRTTDTAPQTTAMLTGQDILERGWNKILVKRFLPAPDVWQNDTNFYDPSRIAAIEDTAEFQQALRARIKLSPYCAALRELPDDDTLLVYNKGLDMWLDANGVGYYAEKALWARGWTETPLERSLSPPDRIGPGRIKLYQARRVQDLEHTMVSQQRRQLAAHCTALHGQPVDDLIAYDRASQMWRAEDGTTYFSQNALLQRGWTKSTTQNILGEPDRYGPALWQGKETRLYLSQRVLSAEALPGFGEAFSTQPVEGYITQQGLFKQRGWTKWMVDTFLPEPDIRRGTIYHRTVVKLYRLARVEMVEASPEFQEAFQRKRHIPRDCPVLRTERRAA